MSAVSRKPARQPWPLWPVALAIIVCLAGYTYMRLAYAKSAKPHEPFADNQRRADTARLKAAGWEQADAAFEATVELPALDAPVQSLPVRPEAADELQRLSSETWHLPIEYSVISVAGRLSAGTDLPVHFAAELDQARAHIVSFDLFRKGADLVAVPRWEPYPAELTPRRPRTSGTILLRTATLPPGHYRVTFPAIKQSSQWELTVAATPAS